MFKDRMTSVTVDPKYLGHPSVTTDSNRVFLCLLIPNAEAGRAEL